MTEVYLHVGWGKTGTTSIQVYLARRKMDLLNAGVHYLGADGRGQSKGHQTFAKSFIIKLPHYMVPPVDADRCPSSGNLEPMSGLI